MSAPKAADVGFTDSDIAVMVSTLCHLESFSPKWKDINEDLHVKNSSRDFRKALKKLGLEINKGVIIKVEGDDDDDDTAAAAPITKGKKSGGKTASTKKGKATAGKKRGAVEADLEEDEAEEKKAKPEEGGEANDEE